MTQNNRMKLHEAIYKTVLSGIMISLGLLLPLLTGQIPEVGSMLLPMHLPVMLTGIICGWGWGMAVGGITPLLRSLIFSSPMLFPTAISMSFELCTYGAVIGILFFIFRYRLSMRGFRTLGAVYLSLIPAMILGRGVFGISQCILLGVGEGGYTPYAFLSATVLSAIPGIIIQLVFIPAVILAMEKCKLLGNQDTPRGGVTIPSRGAAEIIASKILEAAQKKRPAVIAIEGRCCAGKTTLANEISGLLPEGYSTVVHLDDFFLRPEQKSDERWGELGGGFDRERLIDEVLLPISQGQGFVYTPFDCKSDRLTEGHAVDPTPVLILEGSYSSHPSLRKFVDLSVFVDIDADCQAARVSAREGEAGKSVFLSVWIPRENEYFDAYRPRERADFTVISTDEK